MLSFKIFPFRPLEVKRFARGRFVISSLAQGSPVDRALSLGGFAHG
jgi:hypothetical protein